MVVCEGIVGGLVPGFVVGPTTTLILAVRMLPIVRMRCRSVLLPSTQRRLTLPIHRTPRKLNLRALMILNRGLLPKLRINFTTCHRYLKHIGSTMQHFLLDLIHGVFVVTGLLL